MKVITGILNPEDIEIYGFHIPEDGRGAGYNIGDLLNMPHLADCWDAHPHHTREDLERMYLIGEKYVGSVLGYYIESRPSSEVVPYIPRVLGAVRKYAEKNRHKWTHIGIDADKIHVLDEVNLSDKIHVLDEVNLSDKIHVLDEVSDKENICVHIRSGDKEVEPEFLDLIADLSQTYKKVYIMSGLHLDQYYTHDEEKVARFQQTMNNILGRNKNIRLVLAEPDEHLSLMFAAANLLIHKGGFSVLGSIVNQGQLYVTPLMKTVTCGKNWKLCVDRQFMTIPI
jgi:hypothetical protein